MFIRLSKKITNKLENHGIVSKSDKALYEYGLRQMFTTVLNILTMLLIGFSMKMVIPAILYTLAYIPIRIYAGGYHASTPQRCWAFSAVMLFIVLCIVKYTPEKYFWYLTALSLIAGIVIIFLSPVEDQNKPLDETEHHVYHVRTVVVVLTEMFAVVILYVLQIRSIVTVFEMVWCSLAIMLMLGQLKNRKMKTKKEDINA